MQSRSGFGAAGEGSRRRRHPFLWATAWVGGVCVLVAFLVRFLRLWGRLRSEESGMRTPVVHSRGKPGGRGGVASRRSSELVRLPIEESPDTAEQGAG